MNNKLSNSSTSGTPSITLDSDFTGLVEDTFSNPMLNLGFGTGDPLNGTVFTNTRSITWDIFKIDAAVRSEPFFRKALEYHSMMPLINGIDIYSNNIDSERIEILEAERQKHDKALRNMMYQGFAYGGAGGLIMIKDQTNKSVLEKPLDLDTISQGDFIGIKPVDRWFGIAPTGDLLKDIKKCIKYGISPIYLGEPEYFYVWFDGHNGERFKVHRSRLFLFNSTNLPFIEKRVDNYWGNSLLEVVYQVLVRYNNGMGSAISLVNKLNQYVVQIDGIVGSSQANKQFLQMIQAKLKAIAYGLQTNNTLFLSTDDEFTNVQGTMAGVSDIVATLRNEFAAALKVSVSVLFGVSSNNDEQIKKDSEIFVKDTQEMFLREVYDRLVPIIHKSYFGEEIPKAWTFKFKPLYIPTEKEIAETIKIMVDGLNEAYKSGLLDLESAISSLPDVATNPRDVFHNISDALKAKAVNGYGYFDMQIELAKAQQKEQVAYSEQHLGGMSKGGDHTEQKGKPLKMKIGQKEK